MNQRASAVVQVWREREWLNLEEREKEKTDFKLKLFCLSSLITGARRDTGVGVTCIETCQGQECGIASTPFTTLRVSVFGFTAGFPQFSGQSGKSKKKKSCKTVIE